MTTTVTESGQFERIVRFQLTDDQITAAKRGAARKLASEVKIHGFRPGKAPVPVVEATVGADRVRREAIDDLVPPTLTEVLDAEEIRPAVTPELTSIDDVAGGVEVEVTVTLWPTIELPKYKDRNVEVTNPRVSDEDLEAQITRMLEQFATVEEVERPAQDGDFVSIDVEASEDGEPIEETTAADLLYEVGSGLFIEGIDDNIVGVAADGEIVFEAPLPQGFGDRAGNEVTFRVKVNEVKERILPVLDDEWVDENTEFETVDELTTELRDRLGDAKLRAVSREYTEKALSTLRDQIEIELPDALIRSEVDGQLHNFLHRLEETELTLDDYFRASGISEEVFLADLRRQAEFSIGNRLVLEAVAEAEEIDVTEDDLSDALQSLAARSDDPVAYLQAFRESGQELALASDILRNRALDAILTNATPVDEDGNPVDLSLAVPEVEAEVIADEAVEAEVVAEVVEEEE
ncbi:MAG: trigger factor [Acidobacteria bacterium]|nr:trigger factor [Acidobacteriota bacterium]